MQQSLINLRLIVATACNTTNSLSPIAPSTSNSKHTLQATSVQSESEPNSLTRLVEAKQGSEPTPDCTNGVQVHLKEKIYIIYTVAETSWCKYKPVNSSPGPRLELLFSFIQIISSKPQKSVHPTLFCNNFSCTQGCPRPSKAGLFVQWTTHQ